MATGWLGWPPLQAWDATIPEIIAAMDAKIEWTKMTNPFGSGKKEEPKKDMAQFLADVKTLPGTKLYGK